MMVARVARISCSRTGGERVRVCVRACEDLVGASGVGGNATPQPAAHVHTAADKGKGRDGQLPTPMGRAAPFSCSVAHHGPLEGGGYGLPVGSRGSLRALQAHRHLTQVGDREAGVHATDETELQAQAAGGRWQTADGSRGAASDSQRSTAAATAAAAALSQQAVSGWLAAGMAWHCTGTALVRFSSSPAEAQPALTMLWQCSVLSRSHPDGRFSLVSTCWSTQWSFFQLWLLPSAGKHPAALHAQCRKR